MKTTQYLYDIDPSEFADMPYKDALAYKVEAGRKLISHLMYDFHYSERDDVRANKVHAAIKFNNQLLKEL